MEKFMKREVVVIPFPFSNLKGVKKRPALVIADWGKEDIMLCQITSKAKHDGFEVELKSSDFENGGLPIDSHIRPNKIFTATKTDIIYTAGKINPKKYQEVINKLIHLVK
ncbi:MAG TPA: type II toxin-antitoxin system PemK/MazF family toxin [Chitinophagales bacterium]|nr:type II toxin-antitoxin system PemK/MazF family toxin [Chitinophagales bacterium]HRB67806.1 type II toxin-antitoxin system PemK/MazF family toxin [Chitinophagales bacterium]